MPDPAKMEAVVHAYIDGFGTGDADAIAALYAQDGTAEDPVGSPIHTGREAIRAFYAESMKTGAKLRLDGPVRVVADQAAFPFSVHLEFQGAAKRIDVIDTFRFNDANEIVEMRAFWGAANAHDI
ncbi:MAG: nuclear transport factor 2 family protein [Novosphingobium sp.]